MSNRAFPGQAPIKTAIIHNFLETFRNAAIDHMSSNPICASVLVDTEESNQEDDLQDHVGIDRSVSNVCKWMRNIGIGIFSTENFEAVRSNK